MTGVASLLSSILVLLLQPAAADAQLAQSADPLPESEQIAASLEPSTEASTDPAPALLLPKGYQIVIAVEKEVGSKISGTGEAFPIRLAQAVVIDGVEVLPAGITGEGQVVHAKKAGMAGSAGELVLAARYLDFAGRRIDLRSFKFIEEGDAILSRGQNNIDLASATNAIIGPLGFLIGGGNTTIAPGTLATAKTRNDEAFDRPAAAPDEHIRSNEEGMP
jgi:hypothetical protein